MTENGDYRTVFWSLVIALHDADCRDRRCSPLVMSGYIRSARHLLGGATDAS